MFDLGKEFPIPTQTSISDKATLLRLREVVRGRGSYSYLEIGSFMGGTLVPFLADSVCREVFSIDKRGQVVGDERGAKFDYSAISQQAMFENLAKNGVEIRRLSAFDGDISDWKGSGRRFDLLFIDGEHTDAACFHDFTYGRRHLKHDAIVAFHDSTLVHGALRLLIIQLKAEAQAFRFCVARTSEVSFLALGKFAAANLDHFDLEPDLDAYFVACEAKLLEMRARNRIRLRPALTGFKYVIRDAPTFKQRTGKRFTGPPVPVGVKIEG